MPRRPETTAERAATVGTALIEAATTLRAAGSPSSRLDAEVLLAHVEGRDRSWLLAHPEAALADPVSFAAALSRRAAGEPVAYIRGYKDWRSLAIQTDRRALIPRPETEWLLEAVIAELAVRMARDGRPIRVWDVGTGSGAISVALARRFREAISLGRVALVASDVDPDALELASENLERHGVEAFVDVACADLLEPAGRSMPRPDVVVANLPYVPTAAMDADAWGLSHEPRLALDGGHDGLEIIRRLLDQLPTQTAPGAVALLEIGAGQAEVVRELAGTFADVSFEADLAGIARVARIAVGPAAA
jgi:release factor glutamine methyltransferase